MKAPREEEENSESDSSYESSSKDKVDEVRKLHDEQILVLQAAKRALAELNRKTMKGVAVVWPNSAPPYNCVSKELAFFVGKIPLAAC
jgi:hypothetical protein